jgi:hypothetical protein
MQEAMREATRAVLKEGLWPLIGFRFFVPPKTDPQEKPLDRSISVRP